MVNATLKFSIIGSNEITIELIKDAFKKISFTLMLCETYKLVDTFMASGAKAKVADCIAMDLYSFNELERKQNKIAAPLIVFVEENIEVKAAFNLIFDVIRVPVSHQTLENTIQKLEIAKRHFEKPNEGIKVAALKDEHKSKTLLIKKGKEFHLINTETVAVFYSDNKLTFAFDEMGAKFIVPATLVELENELSSKAFFRANRQSLINVKHINKIRQLEEGRFEILIKHIEKLKIDISQEKFSRLKRWIENN